MKSYEFGEFENKTESSNQVTETGIEVLSSSEQIIPDKEKVGIDPQIKQFFDSLGPEKTVLFLSSFNENDLTNIKKDIEDGHIQSVLTILKNKESELDGYPV
jgi:hypothetical protein